MHNFQPNHRLALVPLGFVTIEAWAGHLLFSSFHTFPDEHTIVKTQSLINANNQRSFMGCPWTPSGAMGYTYPTGPISGGSDMGRKNAPMSALRRQLERLEERWVPAGDMVLRWNTVMLDTAKIDHNIGAAADEFGPTRTSRAFANRAIGRLRRC